jgi:PAS domain S-box-containing protein
MKSESTFSFEMLFKSILTYSIDGIVIADETGTILFWNDSQARILNISEKDTVGQKLWDVQFSVALPGYQTANFYHNLKNSILSFLETGKARWSEKIFEQSMYADDKKVAIQSVVYPVKTDKGFMIVGIFRDVTSQKDLEQNRREKEIERLRAEEFELKVAAQKRELTTMAIHCANKNQTLGQIRDTLKTLLTSKKITPDELRPLIKKIENNISLDKDWETFRIHFDQVHPSFFNNLKSNYTSITLSDQKLCAYIKIGLSPKEISRISNLSFDGLKSAKFRLKKKFNLDKNQSLTGFIHTF